MSIEDLEEMGFKLKLDGQSSEEVHNIIDNDLFREICDTEEINFKPEQPIWFRTNAGFVFNIYYDSSKIKNNYGRV